MNTSSLRIALVADVFPPIRSSGAVQLRDLALELVRQGHRPTVIIPEPGLKSGWQIEDFQGVQVARLSSFTTKDTGYIRRTVAEFLLPYLMLRHLKKSPLADTRWDGVVWYSPTIFLSPIAKAIKKANSVRAYLIIRDIFPEWAVDMGLLKRHGLPHAIFKVIAKRQYSVADVIGVQTPANLPYFARWANHHEKSVEVLQNWLAPPGDKAACSFDVNTTPLRGRKIIVYAGNMGVAQGLDIFIEVAAAVQHRQDIGFLFVGRGTRKQILREACEQKRLNNVYFHNEIDSQEIPSLYAQCHVGLVSLDPRHSTHNIPGKFLTYMQSGLPVLARVNPGNDLLEIIHHENVGRVSTSNSIAELQSLIEEIVDNLEPQDAFQARCHTLLNRLFSAEVAARQVVNGLLM